jgi:hypothetical protein
MEQPLEKGQWYRLTLPMGREFIAEYREERAGEGTQRWFYFTDGSRKKVADLEPYLDSIEPTDPPDPDSHLNVTDFFV